ncbi:MAG TPA: flagellar M-ring protein FliF [Deltaproteobacteria bacterium]|nr:flagellar M-ring protein FliF [Deltaproteobacteria bacterium]
MNIDNLFTQLKDRFTGMSMTQRFAMFAVIGLAAAIISVTLMWSVAPTYQYLFTDLDQADASLIVQTLKESRTPYKLSKGGTAIMIPEKNVYETRLSLASQGLPKGGVEKGFALFDETGFSTSEFVQKINYQRALQNELANTIMSLEEVDYARVHIAMPKESIFIEDEKPAKASIVIKPKQGRKINPGQVQGIVYLVAKSIRGLETDNISIVDISGKVLFEGRGESQAISLASNYLDIKHGIENMLQSRAQDLLEKIVGPSGAIVKVSADINMDMVKSVEDSFDPEMQVIRSEELKNEFSGGDRVPGGIAGTPSNLPTGRGGPGAIPANANAGGSNIVRNYEIGRNQIERIQSPGNITRLTVSVVVDGQYRTDDTGKQVFVPRQTEELKGIENAVRHAVGFSTDREDTISVSCMPFAQQDTDIEALSEKAKMRDFIVSILKPVVFLLVTLLILLFVIRPLLRWLFKSVRVVEKVTDKHRAISSEEAEQIEAEDVLQIEAVAKSEEMKHAVKGRRKLIEKSTKDDMGTATAVVKSWLQESV